MTPESTSPFINSVKKVINIATSESGIIQSSPQWITADSVFFTELHRAKEEEILEALKIDKEDSIPYYMKIEMYQKIILLNDRNSKYFKEFAEYLRAYTTNWNYLAEYLEILANRLEQEI